MAFTGFDVDIDVSMEIWVRPGGSENGTELGCIRKYIYWVFQTFLSDERIDIRGCDTCEV